MTAKLTIVLDRDALLKALRRSSSIRIAAGSAASAPRSAGSANAKDAGVRPGAGGFREGSLPARLMAWAKGRKTFGTPDLMTKFKIKRGHASMLLAYVQKGGTVRRVGRGEYAVA